MWGVLRGNFRGLGNTFGALAVVGSLSFAGAGPHIKGPAASANPLYTQTYRTDGAAVNAAQEEWAVDVALPNFNSAVKAYGWRDNLGVFQEVAAFTPRENYLGVRGIIARTTSTTPWFIGKSVAGSYNIGWLLVNGDQLNFVRNGASVLEFDGIGGGVRSVPANSAMTFRGNRTAGDAGSDVVLGSQATRTAGKLLDVQNNGTNKAGVDFDGTIRTVAGITALGSLFGASFNDLSSRLQLTAAGSSPNGEVIINALNTSGFLSFQTNSTARARVDANVTASETALLLSIAGAAVQRVSVGANDSGGAGFRVLRVAN